MEPAEYLRALRPRWWVILVAVLMGAGAAWMTMPSSATTYEATHTLVGQSTAGGVEDDDGASQSVAALAFLMTTNAVAERVAAVLGEDDPEDLAGSVEAESDDALRTLSATATADDPERAEAIADAFATELLGHLDDEAEARRQDVIADLSETQAGLEQEISDLERQIAAAGPGASATLLGERDAKQAELSTVFQRIASLQGAEPAAAGFSNVPATASSLGSTSPKIRLVVGMVVGFMLGIGLALVLARFDRRIRTRDEAERAFELPVVAEVPRLPRRVRDGAHVVVATDPESLAAEGYRRLRTAVARAGLPSATKSARRRSSGTRVVVVVSPGIGEGKTSTVANLAAAYAETGRYVLVLNCDLRRPALDKYLSVAPGPGLSDVLANREGSPRLADVVRASPIDKVRVVSTGSSVDNPSEVIGRVPDLISLARDYADVVIVDTAPFLATDDVSAMLPVVDAVVVCCRAGRTTSDAAQRTTELLGRLGAPVVGVALVGAPRIPTGRSYHYEYYLPRQRKGSHEAIVEPAGPSDLSLNGGPGWWPVDGGYERDDPDAGPSDPAA